jgi:L-serine dehydratase
MVRSVFDIIGPAMIGPSSSHTAGAVRMGLAARHLLGADPLHANIGLHGSFAATGHGHATDRGLVAGLLGWRADDERLKDSLEFASQAGLKVEFHEMDLGESVHPNSACMELNGELVCVASSIGGGSIETVSVDGYAVRFSGSLETLVIWHEDRPGFLAHVTSVLACIDSNIASIRTARFRRGAEALTVIEMDASPQAEVPSLLRKIDHVKKLRILPPLQ